MSMKRTTIAIGLAALVLAAAAALADAPAIFSHKLHLEQGAGCADCHNVAAGASLAPTAESCSQCHEQPMLGAKPASPPRRLKLVFDHPKHAASLECKSCHAAVETDAEAPGKAVLAPADCFRCHEESGVATPENACAACHGKDMRKAPPTDHKAAWLKRHGKEADWRVFGDHGRECNLCHKENECASCHRQRRPADHTGLWNVRLHGKAAEWDRNRCQTCHETGLCIRCHRETKPQNHVGNWRFIHGRAGDDGAGCKTCHTPFDPTCVDCHK